MSSAIRFVSEVPARVKYFVAIAETSYWHPDVPGVKIPSVVTETEWEASTDIDIDSDVISSQYKDMGREVTVVNASGMAVDKYCLVQRVDGPASEGVPEDYVDNTYYVKVWSATARSVTVVRTG